MPERSVAQPTTAPTSWRWRSAFAGVLAVAMAVGTFPGYAFGVLAPQLVDDFALSRSQLGLLTTVFFIVGGAGSLVAGSVVDRLGGRRVMVTAMLILAAAVGGMALSPSYGWLLAMSAIAGVALATGNPTTNKLVAERIAPGRRGVTMGVKQAGVQVGAFLTGALLAPAAVRWGWRAALAASVVVPLAGAVTAVRVVDRDQRRSRGGGSGAVTARALPPQVRRLTVYAFLMGVGVAAVTAYLPLYAVETLSFSPAAAGALAAVVGLVGVISRVAWGPLAERLSGFAPSLLAMGAGAAVAIGLLLLAAGGRAPLVWAGAVLLGATGVSWNAVGMLAVLTSVGTADAGRATGVVLFGFYTGFVPSPILFGAVVDRAGSYTAAWIGVMVVFAVAAAVMLHRPAATS